MIFCNGCFDPFDGVIDTIQWEGYREGVDDVRYVTTLEAAIKAAKQDPRKAQITGESETFLKNLDAVSGDLDSIRKQIIEYIIALEEYPPSSGGS